jgi:hypothetical protein
MLFWSELSQYCGHTSRWRKCGVKSVGDTQLQIIEIGLPHLHSSWEDPKSILLGNLIFLALRSSACHLEAPGIFLGRELYLWGNFFSPQIRYRLRKNGYTVAEQRFFKKLRTAEKCVIAETQLRNNISVKSCGLEIADLKLRTVAKNCDCGHKKGSARYLYVLKTSNTVHCYISTKMKEKYEAFSQLFGIKL